MVFGVYENTLNYLQGNREYHPTLTQLFIAGTAAGVVNSFISSPLELVKIQLQNQRGNKLKGNTYTGPLHCLKHIYKTGGTRLCFRGLGLTIGRELSYGPYFITYELVCQQLLKFFPPKTSGPPKVKTKNASHELNGLQLVFAGGLAGISGWIITYPLDVIKTCIQGQNINKKQVYKNSLDCAKKLHKEEGAKIFTAGLNAALIRSIPLNAATFFVYTSCMKFMDTYFK